MTANPLLCETCERAAADLDGDGKTAICSWCGDTFELTTEGQRRVRRDLRADADARERRRRRAGASARVAAALVEKWHVFDPFSRKPRAVTIAIDGRPLEGAPPRASTPTVVVLRARRLAKVERRTT